MKRFLIRADASTEIGTGHVMRCLALAERLRRRGGSVTFWSARNPGHLQAFIASSGFDLIEASSVTDTRVAERYDWLIVDHYGLEAGWEAEMRHACERVMVIDDLADREHDCDVLLDQNLYVNMHARYDGLVPDRSVRLLGPSYALLRPEFARTRGTLRRERFERRLMVAFGGSDPTNETCKTLSAIAELAPRLKQVEVVVGQSNPHYEYIRNDALRCENAILHYPASNMAEIMARSDLAVCAGGTMTWERFCMGLPAIVIAVADNQIEIARTSHELGIDLYLGRSADVGPDAIANAIRRALVESEQWGERGKHAMRCVDGHGTEKVADTLFQM